jgi:hypothetical protein
MSPRATKIVGYVIVVLVIATSILSIAFGQDGPQKRAFLEHLLGVNTILGVK